ncbi:MAG: DUF992 domain-containing protein [Hyphomicrobiaceae bacterium]|nr:DUF992 domain-containing protein [Hyphomicrobiaceae bacterium]
MLFQARTTIFFTSAVIALSMLFHTPAAMAQDAKVKVGTLTCQGQGKVGLILGSKETLNCTFKSAGSKKVWHVDGTITNVGLDVGIKGKSIMVWGVLGSTTGFAGDALNGNFVGAAADASLGLGAGAKVLVGGNNDSVVLQPLSVQGQTGINLAVGVAGLKLRVR